MRGFSVATSRMNQFLLLEDLTDRARRRPAFLRLVLRQPISNCDGAIEGISLSEIGDALPHFGADVVRMAQIDVSAIGQTFYAVLPESFEQFVPRLFTNTKLAADLRDPFPAIEASLDKTQSLRHE